MKQSRMFSVISDQQREKRWTTTDINDAVIQLGNFPTVWFRWEDADEAKSNVFTHFRSSWIKKMNNNRYQWCSYPAWKFPHSMIHMRGRRWSKVDCFHSFQVILDKKMNNNKYQWYRWCSYPAWKFPHSMIHMRGRRWSKVECFHSFQVIPDKKDEQQQISMMQLSSLEIPPQYDSYERTQMKQSRLFSLISGHPG